MLDRAITIIAAESGVLRVTVHRDPAQGYSAGPGLALLQRLAPLIEALDRAALERPAPAAADGTDAGQ
jgi:hypothetical protein